MQPERAKTAERTAWAGIVGNLLLAVTKGAVGFASGSKALLADAANSASDVAGSLTALIGLRAANKPPDKEHPYGHGKAESVASIIVSVLLLFVGAELFIGAAKTIFGRLAEAPAWYAALALLISIVVKEAMYQYTIRAGRKLSSQTLVTVAWDHRADVLASAAALLGVGGALIGEHYGVGWMLYLDPAAGMIVAGFVVRMGYKLLSEAISGTLDQVLQSDQTKELENAVLATPGVLAVDDLRARVTGHYVIVDVKISVNPRMTVYEGHDIAKTVKQRLMEQFSHVSDVFVHVNPYVSHFPTGDGTNPDSDHFANLVH
jgi:cation diffusion facilitator family transporter